MLTYQSTSRVAVSASGNRTDVSKLDSGNITVKLDLGKVYEPGTMIPLTYSVSYPGGIPNGAITTTRKNPDTIYVTVEERREKNVPVEVIWTGATPEGYMSDRGGMVLDYEEITVVGPASVADLIEKAVIEVDLTDRRETLNESYRYTLCDAQGNPVDAEMIKTNVEAVQLQVSIRRIQELRLRVDVTYGGGVGLEHTQVTLDTDSIQVSGSEAALEALGSVLTVGKINTAEIHENKQIPFTIRLPEGITNETGITEVTATVKFTGVTTAAVDVFKIDPINVPEGLEVEIVAEKLTIRVRGPKADQSLLENAEITATVDLSDAVPGESMKIPVVIHFPDNLKAFGAVGAYSVTVNVRQAQES